MPRAAARVPGSRPLGVVLLALLTGLTISLAPVSAQAHDYLVGSTPEQGATVTDPPDQVSLQFNTAIGQRFAQVAVVGEDGTSYTAGEPVVDGALVTQAVSDLPADGVVTISYRVVSSDGHPIGGTVPFIMASASPDATAAPTATPTPSPTPSPTTTASPATDETSPAANDEAAISPASSPLLGAGLLLAAVLAALGVVVARRRSRHVTES